jgi:hypothetical protein
VLSTAPELVVAPLSFAPPRGGAELVRAPEVSGSVADVLAPAPAAEFAPPMVSQAESAPASAMSARPVLVSVRVMP